MSILTTADRNVNADPFADFDDATYELGPDPDDAQWLAEQSMDWDAADAPDFEPSEAEEADALAEERAYIAATFDRRTDDYAAMRAAEDAHTRGLSFA